MLQRVLSVSLNLLLSMNVNEKFKRNCTKYFNSNSLECYVT